MPATEFVFLKESHDSGIRKCRNDMLFLKFDIVSMQLGEQAVNL